MFYVREYEHDASNFEPWGGALNRWYELDGDAEILVHDFLDEFTEARAEMGHPLTETDINDWIWFECEDWLADEQGLNLDGTLIESE